MSLYFDYLDLYSSVMKGALSSQGQVTIPKGVREALGLRPGDQIEFELDGDTFIGRRRPMGANLDRFIGLLGDGRSTDEVMAELRPERAWDSS